MVKEIKPLYETYPDRSLIIFDIFSTIIFIAFFSGLFVGADYVVNLLYTHPIPLIYKIGFYGLMGFILIMSIIGTRVRYHKARFLFYADRIIQKGGGLFSDFERELVIKNITHVTKIEPFIRNKLFSVGQIQIQSAGSSGVEIVLWNVNHLDDIYAYIKSIMQKNGFSLNEDNMIQEEQPVALAVFFEVFKVFLIALFFGGQFAIPLIFGGAASGDFTIAIYVLGSILGIVSLFLFFHYMDLRRRVYTIYGDCVTYKEGFLTRIESILPVENITNTSLTQTFVDMILGLSDVKISCQGATNEVVFKNMRNAKDLSAKISALASSSKSLSDQARAKSSEFDTKKNSTVKTYAPLKQDSDYTASFSMNIKPTIYAILLGALPLGVLFILGNSFLPFVLSYVFPIGLVIGISIVSVLVRAYSTNYKIEEDKISYSFEFMRNDHREFTIDKVVAVIFTDGIFNRFTKTFTSVFKSIGSGIDMTFKDISDSKEIRKNILHKFGMDIEQKPFYEINSKVNLGNFLKSHFALLVFLGFVYLLSLIARGVIYILTKNGILSSDILGYVFYPAFALTALSVVYLIIAIPISSWYFSFSKMSFCQGFIIFKKGIFRKVKYYVPMDSIRDTQTLQYPYSNFGDLTFNIAGDNFAEQSSNSSGRSSASAGSLIPSSFTIRFIPKIEVMDELVDRLFYERLSIALVHKFENHPESLKEKPVMTRKPSVGKSVFTSVGISLLLSLFMVGIPILFLPIIIVFTVIGTKKTTYILESYRLIKRNGIFYKHQKSVLLSKINNLSKGRGMVDKMFGTGTVVVDTTGSMMHEMVIYGIKESDSLYDELMRQI